MKVISTEDSINPSIREKVKRFYNTGSPFYLKVFGEHIHDGYYITGKESRRKAQENLIKLLAEKALLKKGSRVLDVGCGIGGSSIWLAKNYHASTVGITISPVQRDMAENLAREQMVNSSFLLMDAGEMDFTEPFDAVWVVAALTHFPDQKQFLENAAQFLKKSGKLIIYDWTSGEDISAPANDPDIQEVIEGMVLDNIYPRSIYLKWLIDAGHRIVFSEDLTTRTVKTWDIELSFLKDPATWKLASKITREQSREILTFLKGRKAIKLAMQTGKVKSTAIIAEKN
jgi:tocopherol O-methyltransferase